MAGIGFSGNHYASQNTWDLGVGLYNQSVLLLETRQRDGGSVLNAS